MRAMLINHKTDSDFWQIRDPQTGREIGAIYREIGDTDANYGQIVYKAFRIAQHTEAEAHFATLGDAQQFIADDAPAQEAPAQGEPARPATPADLALINFDLTQLGPIMAAMRTKSNAATLDRLGLAIANACHLNAQGRAFWARLYQTGRSSAY